MGMSEKSITLFKDSDLSNFEFIRQMYPDNWERITGILVMMIIDYAKNGTEPDFSQYDQAYSCVLMMAFNQTKTNLERVRSISEKRAESGSKGGTAKAENMKKQTAAGSEDDKQNVANSSKGVANSSKSKQDVAIRREEKRKEENIKEKKRSVFVPPTVEEVTAYCREKNFTVDPERFVDYYTARGWFLKQNQKMKDWKAAVRTWVKNNYDNSIPEKKKHETVPGQRDAYSDSFTGF